MKKGNSFFTVQLEQTSVTRICLEFSGSLTTMHIRDRQGQRCSFLVLDKLESLGPQNVFASTVKSQRNAELCPIPHSVLVLSEKRDHCTDSD